MRSLLIALFTTFLIVSTDAQRGAVTGKIFMSDSVTLLPGANIFIEKSGSGTSTNGRGNYLLDGIPYGTYELVVSYIGYVTIRKEIDIHSSDTLVYHFFLTESIATLGEAVVMTQGTGGLKEIPGSVHYITPKEIEKFNYTDINRTLRTVPGINIQEEDGFGLRPNIGLRGTGVERSSKITIMEDGVLMAPAPYADPAAYYFPTIGRMQGVEILKGSSQIKYGPFTTGGAINLISTQIPTEFSGRINLIGGSYGGTNLHAFAGNSHKNIAYLVEGFQYGSQGFKELDGGGKTGFDKRDYLAKVRFNTNTEAKTYQSLTFKIGKASETSHETYLGLTEDDFHQDPYRRYAGSQKDLMETEQSQFSATHFINLSRSFHITTTAYRTDFSRNWYKVDNVTDNSGVKTSISKVLEDPASHQESFSILTGVSNSNLNALAVRANNRSYYAQGIQTVLDFNFLTNDISHDINIGFRYHTDEIDRFQWDDLYAMNNGVMTLTTAGVPGTESNLIKSAKAFASYIQYRLKHGRFTVIPGIRYENISLNEKNYGKSDPERNGTNLKESMNHVGVFIPGIGIDYQYSNYLSGFIGIHKGFSPPGVKDETLPENSVNYELGFRYNRNALSGQVVLFFNHYTNLLGADLSATGGTGSGDLFNAGEVNANGVEFMMAYDLLSFRHQTKFILPLTIAYTYTNAVFQNSFVSTFEDWGTVTEGDQFPYLAQNQLTAGISLEHAKFGINLSSRYMDEMRTSPGQGTIPSNEKTDSYLAFDASAFYNFHSNISVFTNATNFTNQVYNVARRPAGLRPGMPSSFNVGLKVNF
ncbi:MAG TPA: TonB-dependent receptor [Saprospiraceae bacterium]|nr:TonB-dependent receptor [Saprospiraceae bacterium]